MLTLEVVMFILKGAGLYNISDVQFDNWYFDNVLTPDYMAGRTAKAKMRDQQLYFFADVKRFMAAQRRNTSEMPLY